MYENKKYLLEQDFIQELIRDNKKSIKLKI